MNSSRESNANELLRWSRRRWMGAAMGVALPSLVMEREASASSVVVVKVTAPTTGPAVWRPIPDPSNPGQFLKSQIPGGASPIGIEAIGVGQRSVTWTATNLLYGYYKIEILYPRHSGNAKGVLVQTRGTLDAGFKALP